MKGKTKKSSMLLRIVYHQPSPQIEEKINNCVDINRNSYIS